MPEILNPDLVWRYKELAEAGKIIPHAATTIILRLCDSYFGQQARIGGLIAERNRVRVDRDVMSDILEEHELYGVYESHIARQEFHGEDPSYARTPVKDK